MITSGAYCEGKGQQGRHFHFVSAVWNLWHPIKFSAYFSCFRGFALFQTPPWAQCLYGPLWWRNPVFCPLRNKFLVTPLDNKIDKTSADCWRLCYKLLLSSPQTPVIGL